VQVHFGINVLNIRTKWWEEKSEVDFTEQIFDKYTLLTGLKKCRSIFKNIFNSDESVKIFSVYSYNIKSQNVIKFILILNF